MKSLIVLLIVVGVRGENGTFEMSAAEPKPLRFARLTYLLREREIFEPVCPCAPQNVCDSFCCFCQLGCEGAVLKSCGSREEHYFSDPVDRVLAFAPPKSFSDPKFYFSLWLDNSVVFGNYVLWRALDPPVLFSRNYPGWKLKEPFLLNFTEKDAERDDNDPFHHPYSNQFTPIAHSRNPWNFSAFIQEPPHCSFDERSLGRPEVSAFFTSNVKTELFDNCSHLRSGIEEETEKFLSFLIGVQTAKTEFFIQRTTKEIPSLAQRSEKINPRKTMCGNVAIRLDSRPIYNGAFLVGLRLKWWRSEVALGGNLSFSFALSPQQLSSKSLSSHSRFWADIWFGPCTFGSCWREIFSRFYSFHILSPVERVGNLAFLLLLTFILYDFLHSGP